MKLYSAIDLHSTNSYIAVLNEDLSVVGQRKLSNDLDAILAFFEPYRSELAGIAVESTFNWYWLVDGLMDAGYQAHLVNPAAVKRYDGLKYTDDRHDARWLAHLLALGILPEGYIYPQEDRPLRDLLRRRAFLVRKRTSLLLAERNIFERNTGTLVNCNDLKRWTVRSVQESMGNPMVALSMTSMLRVSRAIDRQVKEIEAVVLGEAKLRDEFQLLRTVRGIGQTIA
jgi:transposase